MCKSSPTLHRTLELSVSKIHLTFSVYLPDKYKSGVNLLFYLSRKWVLFNHFRWTLTVSILLASDWIWQVSVQWELGCEPCETPSCNQRPGSLNMYANSGVFSGVSVWIVFTVVNGGVTGLKCVTIWFPWHFSRARCSSHMESGRWNASLEFKYRSQASQLSVAAKGKP